MTASVVLRCDLEWYGERCRNATPVGEVLTGAQARDVARRMFRWAARVVDGRIVDVCPACARREATSRAAS